VLNQDFIKTKNFLETKTKGANMSDQLEAIKDELERIASLELSEQPASYAALREALELELNSTSANHGQEH
jgi:hypothetical protein